MKPLAETIPQAEMLRNAIRVFKRRSNRIPTWSAVADICGLGSHHAIEICLEVGIDPYACKFQLLAALPDRAEG